MAHKDPGESQLTDQHRRLLAEGFPGGVFWLKQGVPYVVFPDFDYAEYWGPGSVREVPLFWPMLGGWQITDLEFIAKVRALHGI